MKTSPFDQFEHQPELSSEDVAVQKLSAHELGIEDKARPTEYVHVPATAYHLFPPSGRLLLALLFALRVFGEDEPGGWVKLGQGLTRRFGLEDKDVRRRAVAALEKDGIVAVQRRRGKCTLLNLSEKT